MTDSEPTEERRPTSDNWRAQLRLSLANGHSLCGGEHMLTNEDGLVTLTCSKANEPEPWWMYRPDEDPQPDIERRVAEAIEAHARAAAENAVAALLAAEPEHGDLATGGVERGDCSSDQPKETTPDPLGPSRDLAIERLTGGGAFDVGSAEAIVDCLTAEPHPPMVFVP